MLDYATKDGKQEGPVVRNPGHECLGRGLGKCFLGFGRGRPSVTLVGF